MLAAAVTLWTAFSVWAIAPSLGLPDAVGRTATGLLAVELTALLVSSYGCEKGECTPLGSAAGMAARVDVPVLTAIVLLVVAAGSRRRRLPE